MKQILLALIKMTQHYIKGAENALVLLAEKIHALDLHQTMTLVTSLFLMILSLKKHGHCSIRRSWHVRRATEVSMNL